MFKKKRAIFMILSLLSVPKIFAQYDPIDGPEQPPQEVVPIDNFIFPLILVAILVAFYFFYKQNKKIQMSK